MKILKLMAVCFVAIFLVGCGIYSHEKLIVTETKYPDGRVEVKTDKCTTNIKSMREVKAGDIKVSTKCALTGGAEALNSNQQMMEILGTALRAAK